MSCSCLHDTICMSCSAPIPCNGDARYDTLNDRYMDLFKLMSLAQPFLAGTHLAKHVRSALNQECRHDYPWPNGCCSNCGGTTRYKPKTGDHNR
jgi:hypothetical protein